MISFMSVLDVLTTGIAYSAIGVGVVSLLVLIFLIGPLYLLAALGWLSNFSFCTPEELAEYRKNAEELYRTKGFGKP